MLVKSAVLTLTKAAVLREWFPFTILRVSMASRFTLCNRNKTQFHKLRSCETLTIEKIPDNFSSDVNQQRTRRSFTCKRTCLHEVDDGQVNVAEGGPRLHVEAELLLQVAAKGHSSNEPNNELTNRTDLILQSQSAKTNETA